MENNLKKIYIKKNIQKSTRIYETSKPSFLIPLNPDKFLKTYSRQNITPLRVIQQNENNKLLKSNRKHNRNISLNNNKINIEKNEKILIKKIPLSQSSKNIYVNHNKDIFANKLEENDEFNKLIESDLKDENNIENSSILNTTNKLFNKNKNNEKNKILSTEKKFNNKKIEHKIKDNKKNDSSKSLKIINFSSNSSSYNTHSYLKNNHTIKGNKKNVISPKSKKIPKPNSNEIKKINKNPSINNCISYRVKSPSLDLNKNKIKNKILNNNKNINSQNRSPPTLSKKNSKNFKSEIKEKRLKASLIRNNSASSRTSSNIIHKEYLNQVNSKTNSSQNTTLTHKDDRINKTIIKFNSLCKKGFSGPGIEKINQDNFYIFENFLNNKEQYFFTVCDGHGINGHFVSKYLINNLPVKINNTLLQSNYTNINKITSQNLNDIIKNLYTEINTNLLLNENIDTTFSGSTCVSLIYSPQKIFCINVGDSRCILGKYNKKNNIWYHKPLSIDHKPGIISEKTRILKSEGRIEPYKNENNCYIGPERVWLKDEDVPGLAMSRSFGDDIAHTVGVTCEPEIMEIEFNEEDKFIILASDGIWEFISNQEVVDIVKDFYLKNDLQGALFSLYKEASKRWIMEEEIIDDITLLILYIN
jgi:serine/threonine protein phosphatase PrpC